MRRCSGRECPILLSGMSWGCRQQWIAARLWGGHITCWKGMNGSQVRCRYWLILLGLLRNGGDEVEVWMIYL